MYAAENTQTVAKNLDYNNKEVSAELSKSHVDVLVPEILQVVISLGRDPLEPPDMVSKSACYLYF